MELTVAGASAPAEPEPLTHGVNVCTPCLTTLASFAVIRVGLHLVNPLIPDNEFRILYRVLCVALHHVELWVPDLERATESWGWLLTELGYTLFQNWSGGRSWRLTDADPYIVVEQSAALTGSVHERCAPGLNHLAFRAGDQARVNELTGKSPAYGWRLLFADRHPYAGGPDHYAAYLEDRDGYEVELVAT